MAPVFGKMFGTDCKMPLSIAAYIHQVVQMQPTGGGMAVLYPQSKQENFLVLSVFSMLCCCFIFGLIALISSLRVSYFCLWHMEA